MSQDNADRWLRVFTDEDSITEVDRFSLRVEPEQVIRVDFRTTFTQPVPLAGTPTAGYVSRLDSIQFHLEGRLGYRVRESKFLDNSGHVISSITPADADTWKSVGGRTASGLFSAATQLRPFGTWKVVSYRYATGEDPSKNEPRELKALLGSDIYFAYDRFRVAQLTCDSPILEPTVMTDKEFSRRVGSSLEFLGTAKKVDAIYLRCVGKRTSTVSDAAPVLRRRGDVNKRVPSREPFVNNSLSTEFPPTTLILRGSDNRILLLWEGVFLELERTKNIFLPRSYQ